MTQNPDRDVNVQQPSAAALSPARLFAVAAFIAALLGFVESGLIGFARWGLGRYTHLSIHYLWMAPLWYVLVSALFVTLVLALRRVLSERAQLAAAVFFPALLGMAGIAFLANRVHKGAALVLAAGIALQLARMASTRAPLVGRVARIGVPALLGLIAALAIGMSGGRALAERNARAALPVARADAPNILLIIWDTVRAASLSVYGYERPTTPTLEQLAADGAFVFERAYSTAPWTLPSHASMFTGLYPDELRVDWKIPMDAQPLTLAEHLGAHGYATGGFVANMYYCSRESGLQRGFARYVDHPINAGQFVLAASVSRAVLNNGRLRRRLGIMQAPGRKYADDVNAEFLGWLSGVGERPFFAFLNYFDAHAPYLPPAPFDTAFGPLLPDRDPFLAEGRDFSPRELQAEIDAYEGGIRYLDDRLARLLDELDRRGLRDNTIVIITSDHGEEFGERGFFTHGNTLFERSLHVPLVIHDPRTRQGQRTARWVSLRDLPATVAHMAGLDASVFPGHNLVDPGAVERGPETIFAMVNYARGHAPDYPVSKGDMRSALSQPWQYIRDGEGQEDLFDLDHDSVPRPDRVAEPELASLLERLRGELGRRARAEN